MIPEESTGSLHSTITPTKRRKIYPCSSIETLIWATSSLDEKSELKVPLICRDTLNLKSDNDALSYQSSQDSGDVILPCEKSPRRKQSIIAKRREIGWSMELRPRRNKERDPISLRSSPRLIKESQNQRSLTNISAVGADIVNPSRSIFNSRRKLPEEVSEFCGCGDQPIVGKQGPSTIFSLMQAGYLIPPCNGLMDTVENRWPLSTSIEVKPRIPSSCDSLIATRSRSQSKVVLSNGSPRLSSSPPIYARSTCIMPSEMPSDGESSPLKSEPGTCTTSGQEMSWSPSELFCQETDVEDEACLRQDDWDWWNLQDGLSFLDEEKERN